MERVFNESLRPEWIDEYGHLSEAYYLVAFGNAIWSLFGRLGIGGDYFRATGCGLYAAESHVRYLKEVRAPALLETTCLILGVDTKRIHYGGVMRVEGIERATFESVVIHVDTKTGRTAPIPEAAFEQLRTLLQSERPDWSGRSISLAKR